MGEKRMAIVGIAIALDERRAARERALAALRAEPCLTLGPENGGRVAAVLDVPDREVRGVVERLCNVPGVRQVDLACAYLESALDETEECHEQP
ncbi:MAG: hypothetical protein C4523_05305 [Myxococcales bacterium]|nr:MAG: hypothetical protein C4523_05305 [Myxococcales bacterium]